MSFSTITFDAPSLTKPGERSIVSVTVADSAVLAVIEAMTALEGYTGPEPGMFVVERTVKQWIHVAKEYQRKKGAAIVDASVDSMIGPMADTIVMKKDDVVVTKQDIFKEKDK